MFYDKLLHTRGLTQKGIKQRQEHTNPTTNPRNLTKLENKLSTTKQNILTIAETVKSRSCMFSVSQSTLRLVLQKITA